MNRLIWFYLLGLILLSAWGCRSANNSDKVAEVDGTIIRSSDLDNRFGKELSEQRDRLYRLEKQKLDEYIGAQLLTTEARNRGLSVESLIEKEITAKINPVSDQDIEAFYEGNKSRLPVPLENVREQIRAYLQKQKTDTETGKFIRSLRAKAKISTFLKQPPVYRATVAINDAPSRGAENAKVTIVKFEDFQCPYCKTVQPTFMELLKKYDGKVRVVHKDLPLEQIHPQARPAAEASRCAAEQGKFWEYHDRLYVDSPKLGAEEYKQAAKDVGLNVASFDQCVASGKFKAAVQKDLNEGAQLGLTGTPAFFINGREISGAQPLDAFSAIIDEELTQTR
jgi:protein-disulfide isomerase